MDATKIENVLGGSGEKSRKVTEESGSEVKMESGVFDSLNAEKMIQNMLGMDVSFEKSTKT
jgi:hypothetical protein